MVELSEVVGLGLVIFGTLSLLYGIALCYTVKVRKTLTGFYNDILSKELFLTFVLEFRVHENLIFVMFFT